jgi:hypothetical protein
MKKMIATMIFMSLLSVSCNKSGGSSSDETALSSEANTIDPVTGDVVENAPGSSNKEPLAPAPTSNVPALAQSWSTNVDLYNFSAAQTEKYNKAIALVKKVVATEKFRTRILNHTWSGSKRFASTSKTNAQVYQSILDAAERLTPAKNNVMDVGVKLYYENNTVVGWTNGSITYFNVNTKFFNQYDVNSVAGNLFHEWLHKLGYGHDSAATAQRPYSVPYAVGYIIRDIGKSFI